MTLQGSKDTPRRVAMVMAMDRNKLIGQGDDLPWHIPGDLPYFKATTMDKPVVMGRKTYDSIGRALPGRLNVVVTRNPQWQAQGVSVVTSLDAALALAQSAPTRDNEIMIIGGAGLCREAIPITQRIYLTYIDHEFEGDVWLDSFHWHQWQEVSRENLNPDDVGGYKVSRLILEKLPSHPNP